MGRCLTFSWLVLAAFALLASACRASTESKPESKPPDAANATYTIERRSVTLVNGSAEEPAAPGSATKIRTRLSDKTAVSDLDGDRKLDVAVVLIQDPGGSGTFYYVAVLLNDGSEKGRATNAELLGDRIVVEKLSVLDGQIVVDYLTRRSGEPMAAAPSVRTTSKFVVKESKLAPVP